MTKAKLAIIFIVVILVTLGYCGYAGNQAKWGGVALVLFLIAFIGLFITGAFALFDLLFRSRM